MKTYFIESGKPEPIDIRRDRAKKLRERASHFEKKVNSLPASQSKWDLELSLNLAFAELAACNRTIRAFKAKPSYPATLFFRHLDNILNQIESSLNGAEKSYSDIINPL